jgi:tol-pal system protein YbgF
VRRVAASLLALALLGCGTGLWRPRAGAPEPGRVRSPGVAEDVEQLKARVLELQRKAAMSEVEIAQLRVEIAALRAELAAPPRAATSGGAPSPPATRRPAPPPAVEVPAPAPRSRPAIEEGDLEEDSYPPAASAPPVAAPPGGSAPAASGGQPVTSDGQALYDQAYTLYHQGRYVDSEATFQRFVRAHGATDLADNASYWIGECRYSRGDLRGALAAFRETIARYPEGNKVPDALLKAGQSLEGLGDLDGARAAYDEIARRFPESAAAEAARERRAALR